MVTVDVAGLVAVAAWLLFAGAVVLPLVVLLVDILLGGRPPVQVEQRPEVVVRACEFDAA